MGILDTIGSWLDFGSATLGSPDDRIGTVGDDYLLGNDASQYMSGNDGNDWLRGMAGNDQMYGGNGNDLLEGGSGNDLINGGDGDDTASYFNSTHGVIVNLEFGTAKTLGAGPEDTDTLVSIENVTGSFYDDYLQGTDDANRIDAMAGNDVLNGWGGNDTLSGGFGVDTVIGGDGDDTLSGGFGNDQLIGGFGSDTADYFYAYEGMTINLADGTAHVRFPSSTVDVDTLSGIENVTGSQFDDMIEGNVAANFINGGLGSDTLSYRHSGNAVGVALWANIGTLGDAWGDSYAGIENIEGSDSLSGDVLAGNDGDNIIWGLNGNDVITGRGGNDTLIGGFGNDFVDGGDGNDSISGGEGINTLDGGLGFDTLDLNPSFGGVGAFGPGVTFDMVTGAISGLGMDGTTAKNFEIVRATSFEDNISGNNAANVILGFGNADQLSGRAGNDYLAGGDGDDTLSGGNGDDVLAGQTGADVQTGGAGNDTFFFLNLADSGVTGTTRDLITDFTLGDRMNLASLDANARVAGDQGFSFIGSTAFSGVAGELRTAILANTTLIEADVNGDGLADFQIKLTGAVALAAIDFVL